MKGQKNIKIIPHFYPKPGAVNYVRYILMYCTQCRKSRCTAIVMTFQGSAGYCCIYSQ